MSVFKWTLAMAGTAMGMRYMSERHRRRTANGGSANALTNRDDGQEGQIPQSAAQGGSTAGLATSSGLGSGPSATSASSTTGRVEGSSFDQDDLHTPDIDLTAGRVPQRY